MNPVHILALKRARLLLMALSKNTRRKVVRELIDKVLRDYPTDNDIERIADDTLTDGQEEDKKDCD